MSLPEDWTAFTANFLTEGATEEAPVATAIPAVVSKTSTSTSSTTADRAVTNCTTTDTNNGEDDPNQESPFERMPLELMLMIFNCLNKSGKQAARLVSHEWKQLIDSYFVRFTAVLNDATYDYVCASAQPFQTLVVNSFNRQLPDREAKSSSRNRLALSPQHLIFTYGNVEHSPGGATASPENIATILKLNRKIETLRFRLNSLKGIHSVPLQRLFLPNLTKLEITINREMMYENKVFLEITQMLMPRLTHVIFHIAKFIVFEHEKSGRFYLNMFQFIAKTRWTLRSLEMKNDYYLFFPLLATAHIPLPASQDQIDLLLLALLTIKLTEFSYLFKRPECHPPYNLGLMLLENQSELKKLKIEERNDLRILHSHVFNALEKNASTLLQFSWRVFRYADNAPFIDVSQLLIDKLRLCENLSFVCLYGFRMLGFSNLFTHPERLRNIELEGELSPNVLLDLRAHCVNLEVLRFYHLTPVQRSQYEELAQNLKIVMKLPKLKVINWYVHGLFLHYVPKRTDICIKRGKKGRHYYVITFSR